MRADLWNLLVGRKSMGEAFSVSAAADDDDDCEAHGSIKLN